MMMLCSTDLADVRRLAIHSVHSLIIIQHLSIL